MRTYSIKELENFTGIKAHTIRIWEQRYNLLQPNRTETGYRFYSTDDLRKILSTNVLLKAGIKISKIAALTPDQFKQEIIKIESLRVVTDSKSELIVGKMLQCGLTFNDYELENLYFDTRKVYTTFELVTRVIYPLLLRVGLMWEIDEMTPIQEHFLSNFIRRKLLVEIDRLPHSRNEQVDYVLFLPEQETHEIGLIFSHYLLREAGYNVLFLGQQVPTSNLIKLLEKHQFAKALGFVFITNGVEVFQSVVNELEEKAKHTTFYWSGPSSLFDQIKFNTDRSLYLDSIEALRGELMSI